MTKFKKLKNGLKTRGVAPSDMNVGRVDGTPALFLTKGDMKMQKYQSAIDYLNDADITPVTMTWKLKKSPVFNEGDSVSEYLEQVNTEWQIEIDRESGVVSFKATSISEFEVDALENVASRGNFVVSIDYKDREFVVRISPC